MDNDDDVNNMPTLSVNSLLANLNSRRHQFENCYIWAKWILQINKSLLLFIDRSLLTRVYSC